MDIRCNESYNNLLKTLIDRAPRSGLPLISARARIKKALGVGARGVSLRWSQLRPSAQTVLSEMLSHPVDGAAVQSEFDRFSDPPQMPMPSPKVIDERFKECEPSVKTTPTSRWTSIFQLILGRAMSPSADKAIVIHQRPGKRTLSMKAGSKMWLVAGKNYSMCFLVELNTEEDVAGTIVARVSIPFKFKDARQLFSEYYEDVQVKERFVAAVTAHELDWMAACSGLGDDDDGNTEIFAVVKKQGEVITNLCKHTPRPRKKDGPGPRANGNSGDGAPLPLQPPDGPPAEHTPPGGIHMTEAGGIEYDEDVIEALAAELAREEGRTELEDHFDEWTKTDSKDTHQDAGTQRPLV